MRRLGINTDSASFGVTLAENLAAIKRAGFDCVFSTYSQGFDAKAAADAAGSAGLYYETLHAPFRRSGLEQDLNSMWLPGQNGERYFDLLVGCVNACSDNGIEKCVIHNAVSTYPPEVSEIGKRRFSKLFEYAKSKNVRMAIENLESVDHLAVLMELADDFHGFCWDCGHNLCYTPYTDMPELYGSRMICTHINDNRGITRPGYIHYSDDLHLMPFDGCLNWGWVAEKIKSSGYSGALTLELRATPETGMDGFYAKAYERAVKLSEMCE